MSPRAISSLEKGAQVVAIKCPACGKLNEADAKFCQECGKKF